MTYESLTDQELFSALKRIESELKGGTTRDRLKLLRRGVLRIQRVQFDRFLARQLAKRTGEAA